MHTMKKITLVCFALVFACNTSQKTVSEKPGKIDSLSPVTYAATITQDDLKEHLYTYASDAFEGRETGKPGQKKAVEYLKAHYVSLGIPAAKNDGDYFQKVPLQVANVPVGSVTLSNQVFGLGNDLITFGAANGAYREIAYVGYGIEDGTYSDYQGLDVTDKLVLIKAGEPTEADGTYTLSKSNTKTIWSNMSEAINKKKELALDKGAAGVLYYDAENFLRFKSYFQYMKNNRSGKMSLKEEANDDFLILLNDASVAAIISDIDNDHIPKLVRMDIKLDVQSANQKINSENVVALLKGSEMPEEYVVVSSHLDHIGISADGQINNGADDDGSGSVALLEIAEAFKKAADAGDGPKRSIVFLHVTGEEKGLLGSKYYTDYEPILPLEKTVANLNIDMIGRIDPKRNGDRNYIYLIGSDKLSTELHELSEAVNEKYANIELDYTYNDENDPNRFYYRSDHYNFAKNNIPIIFYFNGTHEDYHRPGDTPDKINYDLLENRTRLVFHTAWEVANRENKVVVDKASK